jgi:hypothetical protein
MTKCLQSDCLKRLKLTDLKCRCGNVYCYIHRLPETHNCSYDFKLNHHQINKLEEEMKCIAQKCIKI